LDVLGLPKAERSRFPALTGSSRSPRVGCSRLSYLAGHTQLPENWVFSASCLDRAFSVPSSWVFSATLPGVRFRVTRRDIHRAGRSAKHRLCDPL